MIYEEIFKEFESVGVRYLVVGGMAVNLFGYARLTMDMDIMVDLSDENLARIVDVMSRHGYSPRVPVSPEELISAEKRDEWIREKGAIVFTFINRQKPFKQIDIFLCNPIDFEEAYKNKVVMTIGDMKMNIISIDDLIRIKSSAGRPRDLEDIHHLERILKLRREE
jgi:predicted nucleotidyltransferase